MSSSARSKVEGPAESFAKSWCEIPLFARDDTFVVFVFVIVFRSLCRTTCQAQRAGQGGEYSDEDFEEFAEIELSF